MAYSSGEEGQLKAGGTTDHVDQRTVSRVSVNVCVCVCVCVCVFEFGFASLTLPNIRRFHGLCEISPFQREPNGLMRTKRYILTCSKS